MSSSRAATKDTYVGVTLATAVVAVLGWIVTLQAQDAKPVEVCRARMEQIAAAFMQYLDASPNGLAPPLSPRRGVLMFDDVGFVPGMLDPAMFSSPLVDHTYPAGVVDDSQFVYLGYMIEDESDLEAFALYYAERTLRGRPLEDVIPLPNPREDGRDVILRIRKREAVPDGGAWKNWYTDAARIPVLIERMTNHDPHGSHVIFLDGHVDYRPFPGLWPRRTYRALNEIDALQP